MAGNLFSKNLSASISETQGVRAKWSRGVSSATLWIKCVSLPAMWAVSWPPEKPTLGTGQRVRLRCAIHGSSRGTTTMNLHSLLWRRPGIHLLFGNPRRLFKDGRVYSISLVTDGWAHSPPPAGKEGLTVTWHDLLPCPPFYKGSRNCEKVDSSFFLEIMKTGCNGEMSFFLSGRLVCDSSLCCQSGD